MNPVTAHKSVTRLEVDDSGWTELQKGRDSFSLAKEPVANMFDEDTVTTASVIIVLDEMGLTMTYEDDGVGFADIRDAWTLFRTTPKRLEPTKRGRFNQGEKEILAIATEASIQSSGYTIRFPRGGGREVTKDGPKRGTVVRIFVSTEHLAKLKWTSEKIANMVARLETIIPPSNIRYSVNGREIEGKKPYHVERSHLETVLLDLKGGIAMMSPTYRMTDLHLHRPTKGGQSWLYELGIPIQRIRCPFSVDVQQKVPLNPNRDCVKDAYLKDIYAEVLNVAVDELDDGKTANVWVKTALEDYKCWNETVKKVMTKRYGEKVVLRSTDTMANERAREAGYAVVDAKTLSSEERERFERVGLQHSSDVFPTTITDGKPVTTTAGMREIEAYAKALALRLLKKSIMVEFWAWTSNVRAQYGGSTLTFNVAMLGEEWFDQGRCPETTDLILHELAHDGKETDEAHGYGYAHRLSALGGQMAWVALKEPVLFTKEGE